MGKIIILIKGRQLVIEVNTETILGLSWWCSYGSGIYSYLPMPSVPITTNVVSTNPAQARCTRCNIKFVIDLWQDGCFLWLLQVSSTDKTEILLRVSLSTITLTQKLFCFVVIFYYLFFSEKLMMSVSNGKEGFLYLSKVLEILLQTLLQDQISEVRKSRLRRVFYRILQSFRWPAKLRSD